MNISDSIAQRLGNNFLLTGYRDYITNMNLSGISILVKNIGAGKSFIPTVCNRVVASLIQSSINRDIIVPIPTPTHQCIKKTSNSIITTFFRPQNRSSYAYSFQYIDTTKGYRYYGSTGLILDDNYKPLLLCGHEMELIPDEDEIDFERRYRYKNHICFISPDVFSREDIISKYIVKKIIPYYSQARIVNSYDVNNINCPNRNVKIIISPEIDTFIHRPTAPLTIDADNDIYNILESSMAILQNS